MAEINKDLFSKEIIDRICVKHSENVEKAVFGEIKKIINENEFFTTVEINETAIVEALKKQIPIKAIKTTTENGKYNVGKCPNCEKMLGLYSYAKGFGHCYECGQALDWRDKE